MHSIPNGRSLAQVVTDIKEEFKDFVQTRIKLFKTETQQKLELLKVAVVLAGLAVVMLATAYALLVVGLVAVIAAIFANNPYHWVFGFFGVAILWAVIGGLAAYFAKREFSLKGIVPRRTFEVLRNDKIWMQHEAHEAKEQL
ncbi:MAG TPA: phage holin family protein [Candidatus Sulfotelmatobacter sp.]|nr:phage holin family protein [Candidatus Sulfotelmatobacter sp.]